MRAGSGSAGLAARVLVALMLVAGGALIAPPARADTLTSLRGTPAGTTATKPAPSAPAAEAKSDNYCAAYGKGFVRVAGSSTCVKADGYIQSDAYVQRVR